MMNQGENFKELQDFFDSLIDKEPDNTHVLDVCADNEAQEELSKNRDYESFKDDD